MLRLGQKVRQHAPIELRLTQLTFLEEVLALAVEAAVQESEEGKGLGGEDLAVGVVDFAEDADALEDGVCCGGHFGGCLWVVEGRRKSEGDEDEDEDV